MYVEMTPHALRIAEEKDEKEKKKEKSEVGEKLRKENKKVVRKVEDGLLLVVPSRIYGKSLKALIDSGATRCFITPACVPKVGLEGIPHDIFLDLGNGEKYLSRGYVPEVSIVTVGLTVKIGLTITNLQHEMDLVLRINWL